MKQQQQQESLAFTWTLIKHVPVFYQDDAISSLNGKPQKSVDQIILLSSNISWTESDVNIHVGEG